MHLDAVCACVCNVCSVLYILWIVIFPWSFVCSLYTVFSLEGKFSLFLFCLFVTNQIKPRKIFSLVSSSASYVCTLYVIPNTIVQHKQIKSVGKRIKQYERLSTKSCLKYVYTYISFSYCPEILTNPFLIFHRIANFSGSVDT